MISKHFARDEFACGCGCGFDTVDVNLIRVLQDLREAMSTPIVVNSGCRCESHNRNEGGSPNSQHLLGKAADIVFLHPNFLPVAHSYLNRKHKNTLGIGYYPDQGFIHIDSRDKKARW